MFCKCSLSSCHSYESSYPCETKVYIDMIMRCLFAKPWPLVEPRVLLPVGKFTAEKIKDLGPSWAKVVDHRHPSLDFAASAGLLSEDKESLIQREEDNKELNLDPIRKVTRSLSDGPEPDLGSKFKKGDEVTITRRVSWVIVQPDDPKYKRDLNVGTEGIIIGFADIEKRMLLLEVIMDLPSGPKQAITHQIYPRNLKLTSDVAQEPEAPAIVGSSSSSGQFPEWALEKSDPASVKIDSKFKHLLADQDKNMKLWHLRSRIGVALQALAETLPTYCDKDFFVIHRKNDRGMWKDELWTKRDFEAHEIMIAPYSSHLKDTHLMGGNHVVVGLPKHGRGSHPDNQNLALDGRSKNLIANKEVLDDDEHLGSLFWLVGKTSSSSDANLSLETATFEHQIKVHLPGPKRRKSETSKWDPPEMPGVPILTNMKTIHKHTKLLVYTSEAKLLVHTKSNVKT